MSMFLPVVHVNSEEQCLHNVELAFLFGTDGVFLINHGTLDEEDFDSIIEKTVSQFQESNFCIGVNFLGEPNLSALRRAADLGCKMLWSDDAGVEGDEEDMAKFSRHQTTIRPYVEFFGGVHFKYQPKPKLDIETSIQRALKYVDFPTLSGPATGVAADVKFIQEAYSAASDVPLAIASGITYDNVDLFLPYIEIFLVASSIIDKSSPDERFDSVALDKLCQKIKS